MPLKVGSIVLVPVPDGHGNVKNRPVVVIQVPVEYEYDKPLLAVAVSTQVTRPIPDHHVKLPWQLPRHPVTGLNRDNVAKCDWIVNVHRSKIIQEMGETPPRQLVAIVEAVRRVVGNSMLGD
ncbi:type II toxin-antitoxin system PemK/MazF family toxin [Singulisphaera rosea]